MMSVLALSKVIWLGSWCSVTLMMWYPNWRLDQVADLADLQGEGGILKRLDHLAAREQPQIAALGLGRAIRVLFGQRREIRAVLDLLEQLLGLGLGLGLRLVGVRVRVGGLVEIRMWLARTCSGTWNSLMFSS